MRLTRLFIIGLIAVALLAPPALAQGAGNIRVFGKVISAKDKGPLPGVTIVFESASLQGVRSTLSGKNGEYTSPPLPAGEYDITFRMDGHQQVTQKVRLSAGQTREVDATLTESYQETVVVTGEATQVISEGTQSAQTITYDTLEQLPVNRTFQNAVLLTPGAHNTGPQREGGRLRNQDDSISISGSQSWDNLLTMDGVVLNENIRGQAFDLYIEDAIQETTTQNSGISAEFGRFTGGVVTAISRSGGNEFSGSFRVSMDNEDWAARTALTDTRIDSQNETFEATVGGRIVRDRLWFFFAGRNRDTEATAQTALTGIGFVQPREEDRLQGKLTASLTSSHQVQLTGMEIDDLQGNSAHGGLTQFALLPNDGTLNDRETPQELLSAQYTGILSTNFFLEAQYTERNFTFVGSGGLDQALDTGTPVFDLASGVVYNESLFCGSCEDEERNNEQSRIKGSYFLNTENSGSHDFTFGYETFTDITNSNNHQSPNDLMVWQRSPSTGPGGGSIAGATSIDEVFPDIQPGLTTFVWLPIINPSQGTDFGTDSLFLNDRWRLNDNWAFNIGLRYDETQSVNSLGLEVASGDALSPRLGVEYEMGADSPWSFHASYAQYVGLAGNSVFDNSSSAGNAAQVEFNYTENTPITNLTAPNVMQPMLDAALAGCPGLPSDFWLDAQNIFFIQDNCLNNTRNGQNVIAVFDIPGSTTQIAPDLTAVNADEISIGFNYLIGQRGTLRVDYVNRQFGDFFFERRDLTTIDPNAAFDRGVIENNDALLSREYDGLHTFFNIGLLEDRRLRLGGNLTWSHARGNFDGETSGSGPVTPTIGEYPELQDIAWSAPEGDLQIDQRISARAWAIYDVIRSPSHNLTVSWLENYFTGLPYEAIAQVNTAGFVANPGYNTPDFTHPYFFSGRGAFRTDDIHRSDIAINYSYLFRDFEFFVQPELINVFKEEGVVNVDTTVSVNGAFNPFTDTPVQGTDFTLGPNFGQALEEGDLQAPREFQISFGFRANF